MPTPEDIKLLNRKTRFMQAAHALENAKPETQASRTAAWMHALRHDLREKRVRLASVLADKRRGRIVADRIR